MSNCDISPSDQSIALTDSTEPRKRVRLDWLVHLLLAAYCALPFISSVQNYLYFPYSDAHDWAERVIEANAKRGAIGSAIWASAGEQRIPLALICEFLELLLLPSRVPTFLVVGGTSLATAGILLIIAIRASLNRSAATLVSALALLPLLNISMAEDLSYPVFSVYIFVVGGAVSALSLLAIAARSDKAEWVFLAALLSAVFASSGNAAGFAVWPAVVIFMMLEKKELKIVVPTCLVALMLFVGFEYGLFVPSRTVSMVLNSPHIIKEICYFLEFIGLPWTRAFASPALSYCLGLIVLASALASFVFGRLSQLCRESALNSLGIALMVFGFLVASMAAIGRVDELPDVIVPTRYSPFAACIQIGALLCASPVIGSILKMPMTSRSATLVMGLAMVMTVAQVQGMRKFRATTDRIKLSSSRFDRGFIDLQRDLPMHPDPSFARKVRQKIQALTHLRSLSD